ncbi:MAG TPA: MarR family transcriptional regulator [Streptosporangiaceae bacterium]|nr:MarR family transcriptional regulator [Streptosporangiaceae bacterium]
MDVGRPLSDVVPGARGQLLATLVDLEEAVTVRALARHAGVAPQTALSVVNDLAAAGLVRTQRAGQAQLVSLNSGHVLAPPLIALARTKARLAELLRGELAGWAGLAGAWLFGAAARAGGDRGSVIDLLLVASTSTELPAWAEATDRLTRQVQHWTGNAVQLIEHSRGSFALLIRGGNPLVAAIRADGIPLTPGCQSLLRG